MATEEWTLFLDRHLYCPMETARISRETPKSQLDSDEWKHPKRSTLYL